MGPRLLTMNDNGTVEHLRPRPEPSEAVATAAEQPPADGADQAK
jgi:hypothetical protein